MQAYLDKAGKSCGKTLATWRLHLTGTFAWFADPVLHDGWIVEAK